MSVSSLIQIEESIRRLSLPDQLHLLEWLARSVRQHAQVGGSAQVDQLAMMAADPDIQRELRLTAAEFVVTESNGVDKL